MGEIADYYLGHQMHHEIEQFLEHTKDFMNVEESPIMQFVTDYSIEFHVWVTKYGQCIPVKEMSSRHIRNCIKCWNGQGKSHIPSNYLGGKEKMVKYI